MPRHVVTVYVWALAGVATSAVRAQTARQWTTAEVEKSYVVFEHSTLARMPSDHVPDRANVTDKLSCALARGEYKSVQFGVHSLEELSNIHVNPTLDLDLVVYRRRAKFTGPRAAETTAADLDKRVARPHEWMYLQRGNVVERLPAGVSVNFWLTIHASADAAPGERAGKIRVEVEGKPATEVALTVKVRPFRLAPARIPFGMYYSRGHYSRNRGPDASHEYIYRDMAAHSQNSVSFSVPRDFGSVDFTQVPLADDHRMVKIINTARDVGLVSSRIPVGLVSHSLYNEYREGRTNLTDAQMRAAIDWLAMRRREHNWPEIMAYGWDEPPVPAPGIRERYTRLRGLPIRLLTAMSGKAAYAYGDLHDVWLVHDGHITPEMQAEATRRGAQVWTYTYRMWRQSYNPLVQRFYVGLYTWALRLGGNYVWEYYYGYNWVDPETKQTMPTTGWEARREGVDDYRYLQMVEEAVNAKPHDPTAMEAAVWLEKLRARVVSNWNQGRDGYWNVHAGFSVSVSRLEPHIALAGKPLAVGEYDQIRAVAAEYIGTLGPARSDRSAPVSHVKDEAAAFRGKTVEQCAEGLRNGDTQTRRSAAMALFEMRVYNDDTIDELIRALDDPDVRVPALMALEVIGPKATRASPKVAALLSHPDDFIRQGATLTLRGLTMIPKGPLAELPKMWAFRKDPDKVGESQKWFFRAEKKDAQPWTQISTHEFWEKGYVGDGWYALDFTIPKTPGKRTWVEFGAVDENYTLWLNGQYIGDNTNAGTGFWKVPVEAEITGRYKPGASSHIVVRVNNRAQAGGIWKPVRVLVQK